ncbi:MAG: aconitate hydratase AcnA [Desulfurella sp.]
MVDLDAKTILKIKNENYLIHSLKVIAKTYQQIERMPFCIKILLENMLRHKDDVYINKYDILNLINFDKTDKSKAITFFPERVVMQDFTGVPAIVDIATLKDAYAFLGGDPKKVDLSVPVDLIIDHSIQVDQYGTIKAMDYNLAKEYKRNMERYELIKWASLSLKNFRAFPPNAGIVHQVNLEYLGEVVKTKKINNEKMAFFDTLIGTDSHTTMINGLSIFGFGVGGIEAEAVILGEPYYMKIPNVIGVRLKGKLKEGSTPTDLALSITNELRKNNVVDSFVEYFGPALNHLSVPDRATISNMSPEYGSTVGFFPIDNQTLEYLELTNRSHLIDLIEAYAKHQGVFYDSSYEPEYSKIIDFDLSSVEPSLAGPSRPQDKIILKDLKRNFDELLNKNMQSKENTLKNETSIDELLKNMKLGEVKVYNKKKFVKIEFENEEFLLSDGSIAIAAITSCTNTSNPYVMIGAGLLAKKAVELGLSVKPYIKTSLAPGSWVVDEYLKKANLLPYLEALRFHVVGHGCTTCIGNSGPLHPVIEEVVKKENLIVASVLSGNRNFEARINNSVKVNYLASPMLVVAFALSGNIDIDMTTEPLGKDVNGNNVFLKDLWPSSYEINDYISKYLKKDLFEDKYATIFNDKIWDNLKVEATDLYKWQNNSTYIKKAPYFDNFKIDINPISEINNARVLALFGDSITTDHISPAGKIPKDYPAGNYLIHNGVEEKDFNTYGSRRGNHEVLTRGTFGNVRLKNLLVKPKEGAYTLKFDQKNIEFIYDASVKYQQEGIPLIVIAGKEYGSGSSRDWAAKGPKLLGVKAILAKSFERIHRSNLIDMGILPLQFNENQDYATLNLDGSEIFFIKGLEDLNPNKLLHITAIKSDKQKIEFDVIARLDTQKEIEYYKNDGILSFVLRKLLKQTIQARGN